MDIVINLSQPVASFLGDSPFVRGKVKTRIHSNTNTLFHRTIIYHFLMIVHLYDLEINPLHFLVLPLILIATRYLQIVGAGNQGSMTERC